MVVWAIEMWLHFWLHDCQTAFPYEIRTVHTYLNTRGCSCRQTPKERQKQRGKTHNRMHLHKRKAPGHIHRIGRIVLVCSEQQSILDPKHVVETGVTGLGGEHSFICRWFHGGEPRVPVANVGVLCRVIVCFVSPTSFARLWAATFESARAH